MLAPINLPLDLTGKKASNLILEEPHTLGEFGDRIFIPSAGSFYADSVILRKANSSELLRPVDQFKILELHLDASKASGKTVCSVIYITDLDLTDVVITYQAIGGEYAGTTQALIDLIDGLNEEDLTSIRWGSILGKPTTYTPGYHRHNLNDMYNWGDVILQLNGITQALLKGDQLAFRSVYDYVRRYVDSKLTDIQRNEIDYTVLDENFYRKDNLDDKFTAVYSTTSSISANLAQYKTSVSASFNEQDGRITLASETLTAHTASINLNNTKLTNHENRITALENAPPPANTGGGTTYSYATTDTAGVIRFATDAESNSNNTSRAVNPKQLNAQISEALSGFTPTVSINTINVTADLSTISFELFTSVDFVRRGSARGLPPPVPILFAPRLLGMTYERDLTGLGLYTDRILNQAEYNILRNYLVGLRYARSLEIHRLTGNIRVRCFGEFANGSMTAPDNIQVMIAQIRNGTLIGLFEGEDLNKVFSVVPGDVIIYTTGGTPSTADIYILAITQLFINQKIRLKSTFETY